MRYNVPKPKNEAMHEKFRQQKEMPIHLRYGCGVFFLFFLNFPPHKSGRSLTFRPAESSTS